MEKVEGHPEIFELVWHGAQRPDEMCRVAHFVHTRGDVERFFTDEGTTIGTLKIEHWTRELFEAFSKAKITSVDSITLAACHIDRVDLVFLVGKWKVGRIVIKDGGQILSTSNSGSLPIPMTCTKLRISSGHYCYDKVVVSPAVNQRVKVVFGDVHSFMQLAPKVSSLKLQEIDLSGENGRRLIELLSQKEGVSLTLKRCRGGEDFVQNLALRWKEVASHLVSLRILNDSQTVSALEAHATSCLGFKFKKATGSSAALLS